MYRFIFWRENGHPRPSVYRAPNKTVGAKGFYSLVCPYQR